MAPVHTGTANWARAGLVCPAPCSRVVGGIRAFTSAGGLGTQEGEDTAEVPSAHRKSIPLEMGGAEHCTGL